MLLGSNHIGFPHESGYRELPIVVRMPPSPFGIKIRTLAEVGAAVVVVEDVLVVCGALVVWGDAALVFDGEDGVAPLGTAVGDV